MRKLFLLTLAVLIVGFLGLAGCGNNRNYHTRMHRNMMQDGMMNRGQNNYSRGGMMGSPGDSSEPMGAMRYDSGTSEQEDQEGTEAQRVSPKEARTAAEKYLQALGNPDLSLGEGSERPESFEFPVVNQTNGQQVATLEVDKKTGAVQSRK